MSPQLASVEHARARAAYGEVQKLDKYPAAKDYSSAAGRLPAFVTNCGLLQALAFYRGKKAGRVEHKIYAAVQHALAGFKPDGAGDDWLFDRVLAADVAEYRLFNREALAYAKWLKRFAETRKNELEPPKEGTNDAGPAGS